VWALYPLLLSILSCAGSLGGAVGSHGSSADAGGFHGDVSGAGRLPAGAFRAAPAGGVALSALRSRGGMVVARPQAVRGRGLRLAGVADRGRAAPQDSSAGNSTSSLASAPRTWNPTSTSSATGSGRAVAHGSTSSATARTRTTPPLPITPLDHALCILYRPRHGRPAVPGAAVLARGTTGKPEGPGL